MKKKSIDKLYGQMQKEIQEFIDTFEDPKAAEYWLNTYITNQHFINHCIFWAGDYDDFTEEEYKVFLTLIWDIFLTVL